MCLKQDTDEIGTDDFENEEVTFLLFNEEVEHSVL
jgi:hypothetical protein